jgi:hypothetical protein
VLDRADERLRVKGGEPVFVPPPRVTQPEAALFFRPS